MSGPKLISPLLDHFIVGDAISNHDGVRCYPAMKQDSDEKYILKVISIPASQVQLDALLLAGAYRDQASALAYFKELADGVGKESEVLLQLSKLESFDAYESWQIAPMDNGVGYDVYLLGTYKRSLEKYIRYNPMTHLSAVNLGLDLCSALAVCRRAGFLYVDLKPSNIYIAGDQTYHIGDLGFVPMQSLKYASLPDKYRSRYTAPEIADAFASLNQTIDIYALGLILYQAYNNGELPFDGTVPSEPLPAPVYADYEIAEIILKACAINPADRWQDPSAMGQALVGYMQRNGVNDTPIIPPARESGASAAEPETEAFDADDAQESDILEAIPENEHVESPVESGSEESETIALETAEPEATELSSDIEDLSFIEGLVSDETAPDEENTRNLTAAALSAETSEMLTQADELIAHEPPEPVIAPEPIDIPVPEPLVLETDVQDTASPQDSPETASEEASQEESQTAKDDPGSNTDELEPAEEKTDAFDLSQDDSSEVPSGKKKKGRGWIVAIVMLLLLAGFAFGGYYYYQNFYLQSIDSITLDGSQAQLTVHLSTQIPDHMLTVTCTDTYGETKSATVKDGSAVFTDLSPATSYNITVKMDGFHQLTGNYTATYTTDAQTNIVNFTANTGATDGSVILSFTPDGPEPEQWTVVYNTDGESEKQVTFSGHNVTIYDLSVGHEYTFRLVADDLYLAGYDTIRYTASKVIYAQNLRLTSLKNNILTINWDIPEGVGSINWAVTQYNEAGEMLSMATVSETEATLPLDDTSVSYTFEVIAEGMTQSAKITMTANPIIISSVLPDSSNPPRLYLQWGFDGPVPAGGWIVTVTADGSEPLEVLSCESNSAELEGFIPGAQYAFTFQAADGTTVFNQTYSYSIPEAEPFEGYWVTADNFEFRMCRTPDVVDWDRSDLSEEDYTTTFSTGENASFLVYLNRSYGTSSDEIVTTFVTRDADGIPVLLDTQSRSWSSMWYQRYCELDIPQIPSAPGTYTLDIYFNGQFAGSQEFDIE